MHDNRSSWQCNKIVTRSLGAFLLSGLCANFSFSTSVRVPSVSQTQTGLSRKSKPSFRSEAAPVAAEQPTVARTHVLLWDFRNGIPQSRIAEGEKNRLREAVATKTSHLDKLRFEGPVMGSFFDNSSRQRSLYIVTLPWMFAGRSNAEGDLAFAVVLSTEQPTVTNIDANVPLRSLHISN